MVLRYVLEAAAIVLVFTKGSIFKSVRDRGPKLWQEFAVCPLCVGVWLGMFWRVLRTLPDAHVSLSFAADVLASGAVTGVFALVVALFLSLLDRYA